MTRERWEVRKRTPFGGLSHVETFLAGRDGAYEAADDARLRGWTAKVVHIRTYRVEVVYAWRASKALNTWWYGPIWLICIGTRSERRIFTDPLGKHSRRRAKAAALAAKPAGPCVLVAVRRRVKR